MTDSKRQNAARMKRAAMSGREYVRNKRIAFWMVVFLVVVAAFVAGFLVRSNIPLMSSLGFVTEEAPRVKRDVAQLREAQDHLRLAVHAHIRG